MLIRLVGNQEHTMDTTKYSVFGLPYIHDRHLCREKEKADAFASERCTICGTGSFSILCFSAIYVDHHSPMGATFRKIAFSVFHGEELWLRFIPKRVIHNR